MGRGNVEYWLQWFEVEGAISYMLRAAAHNRGLAPRESLLVVADSLIASLAEYRLDPAWLARARRLFAILDDASRRYPNDPAVWRRLAGWGEPHFGAAVGRAPERQLAAVDHVISIDSTYASVYVSHTIQYALQLRGREEALRYVRAYLALEPRGREATGARLVEGLLAPDLVRSVETQRLLDTASADALVFALGDIKASPDEEEAGVRVARALRARLETPGALGTRGDPNVLQRVVASALTFRGRLAEAVDVAAYRPRLMRDLALVPGVKVDTARAAASIWSARGWRDAAPLALAWWVATRDTASMRRFLDAPEQTYAEDVGLGEVQFLREAARGFVALARGDTALALERFRALPDLQCPGCAPTRILVARLFMRLGLDREAAATLDGYEAFPLILRGGAPLVLWELERGRVHQRLGSTERAMDSYAFVVDAWANGDPEVQPFVQEARRALARLTGESRR